MARIRTIKPEFFTDDEIAALPMATRLGFIGLWCHADREGRLEDRPKRLKVLIFPHDEVDMGEVLARLTTAGFIQRYEAGGKRYIQIRSFEKHQRPHFRETPSVIPVFSGEPEKGSAQPEKGSAEPAGNGNGYWRMDTGIKETDTAPDGASVLQRMRALSTEIAERVATNVDLQKKQRVLVEGVAAQTTVGKAVVAGMLGFDEFYKAYPVHKARKDAERAWKKLHPPDDLCEQISLDVKKRIAEDADWLRGAIPYPATYLNGHRWTDDVRAQSRPPTVEPKTGQRVYVCRSGQAFPVGSQQRIHWNTPEEIGNGARDGYVFPNGTICLTSGGHFETREEPRQRGYGS